MDVDLCMAETRATDLSPKLELVTGATTIEARVEAVNWTKVQGALDTQGWALMPPSALRRSHV
jgi:hypothetical protein